MKTVKSTLSLPVERSKMTPLDIDDEQQNLAAALADVSLALNSSLHLDDVLDVILENLSRVVAYKTANIMLLEGNLARIVRSNGYEKLGTKEMMLSKVFDIREISHLLQMIKTRKPILSYYPHLEQNWDVLAESEWIKSHIAAPIISNDEVIGFLNCDSDIAGFFNKNQSNAMLIFACQAGLALRNARLYDQTFKTSQKLRLINDLTHQVLNAVTMDEIFTILPERLIEISEGSNVYISRWDQDTQTVRGWESTSSNRIEYVYGSSNPGDQTLTEEILDRQQATLINDISKSTLMDKKYQVLYQEKTLFCLPLVSENEKMGAIIIGYPNAELLTTDIRSLCEYTAVQIAAAVSKIHSLEVERNQSVQLAHANALIESLSHVSTAIKSGMETQHLMSTIGQELEMLNFHSLVALGPENADMLKILYSSVHSNLSPFAKKIVNSKNSEMNIPIADMPILRDIITHQQAIYLEDPQDLLIQIVPEFVKPFIGKLFEVMSINHQTRAILVPLVVEKKSIGLLCLWGEGLQKIDDQAAGIFGGQVAIAIENANLLQEVKRLAITDELTDVLNRRGFDEVANREFVAAKRYLRPLSLIMLDIDRFKAINDVYGHPIGDEILVEIAARARTKIRETDYISRYGGEEFLILLIEQKLDNAKTVAERIRNCVAEQPFNTSVGKIDVTISVGVTSASEQVSSISMMIKTVDKALYKSKENGRNRVTIIDKI